MQYNHHQNASLQLNLAFRPPSNRFGIKPCRRQPPNERIMILASSCLPVKMNKPGNEINVSLPQFLMYPVEKWGNPAAHETFEVVLDLSLRLGDSFGRGDESKAAAC